MKIECPHCEQHYEIDDEYIGQIIECQKCKQEFVAEPLPVPVVAEPPRTSKRGKGSDVKAGITPANKKCPFCRGDVAADAQKCCHCGEWIVEKAHNDQKNTDKNEIVFVILGVFLGLIGVHNFYVNEKAAGFEKILLFLLGIYLFDWFPHSRIGVVVLFINAIWVIVEIIRNAKHIRRSPKNKRALGMTFLVAFTAILFLFFSWYHKYIESKYEKVGDISFLAGQAGALAIYNKSVASLEQEKKINEERDKIYTDALRTPLINLRKLIDLSSNRYKQGSDDIADTYNWRNRMY